MNLYNLKRKIRISKIGTSKFYMYIRYVVMKNSKHTIIKRFLGPNLPEERIRELSILMKRAMVQYRWEFDEFFLFDFENSDETKRKSFVPEYDKNIFCDLINNPTDADIFIDKWDTYLLYKDFFKRSVIQINHKEDISAVSTIDFLKRNQNFMIKPAYGTRGSGIELFMSNTIQDSIDKLSSLKNNGTKNIVCEEVIQQDKRMAIFHPQSCNTIRVCTINYKNGPQVIKAFMRMGRGKSVVDNAGAGGIICNINITTGEIYAACDELGKIYKIHPDSNIPIIGFKVPEWDKAVEFSIELAKVQPSVKYVGWDIALTANGWVMIEGNDKGQFVFQFPAQEGFRSEMEVILKNIKNENFK